MSGPVWNNGPCLLFNLSRSRTKVATVAFIPMLTCGEPPLSHQSRVGLWDFLRSCVLSHSVILSRCNSPALCSWRFSRPCPRGRTTETYIQAQSQLSHVSVCVTVCACVCVEWETHTYTHTQWFNHQNRAVSLMSSFHHKSISVELRLLSYFLYCDVFLIVYMNNYFLDMCVWVCVCVHKKRESVSCVCVSLTCMEK